MNRLFVLTGMLALLFAVGGTGVRAEDKDEAVETSKIMKACFGKGGLCGACISAGNKENWEVATAKAKDFVKQIEKLPKGEPAKGDKAAFEKKAKSFLTKVKALAAAADKMDSKEFKAAAKAVTGSCMACHQAHR